MASKSYAGAGTPFLTKGKLPPTYFTNMGKGAKKIRISPSKPKSTSPIKKAVRAVGKGVVAAGKLGDKAMNGIVKGVTGKTLPAYKKGGMVHKTGPAIVHKGERVLTKKQASKFNAKKYEATRKSVFGLGKNKK